jgi:hypothetical protein
MSYRMTHLVVRAFEFRLSTHGHQLLFTITITSQMFPMTDRHLYIHFFFFLIFTRVYQTKDQSLYFKQKDEKDEKNKEMEDINNNNNTTKKATICFPFAKKSLLPETVLVQLQTQSD